MFKLISEEVVSGSQPLVESKIVDDRTIKISGVFAQADIINKNQHLYPKSVLASAVNQYVKEYVERGQGLGELDHPPRLEVDLKEVCIKIDRLEWDGSNLYGEATVLDTPNGRTVKKLIEGGVKIGVSTRGAGPIHESDEGHVVIGEGYFITAIDVVANPAAPDAYVNGICESMSFVKKDNGVLVPVSISEVGDNGVNKIKELMKLLGEYNND